VCSQSTSLEELFPDDTEGDAAREGTAAHQFATDMLKGKAHNVGGVADNGVVFTQEMQDGAALVLQTLIPWWTAEVYIESPVRCTEIHDDVWGTPDVIVIDRALKIVRVVDYKFGHRFVNEWDNKQLICYAQGAVETYGLTGDDWTIDLTIIQPRYYGAEPVRTFSIDSADLAHSVSELQRMAERSLSNNPVAVTGEHCGDCKARHVCKTLAEQVSWVVAETGHGVVRDLTPETIGTELVLLRAAQDRLQARLDGLEEWAESMMRNGKSIPGWQMQPKFGNETWTQPIDAVIALGRTLGTDLAKPAAAITPTQARKLLGPNAAIVDAFATRPPRGHKLMPISDQKVRKAFGK